MGWDGLVAARNVLAKHKVAGFASVTRSYQPGLRRGRRLVEDEERRVGQ